MTNDSSSDSSVKQKDVYFAAKEPDQLANILLNKGKSFYNLLESNAYLEKLNSMWRAYHGDYGDGLDNGHHINFTGEQGEYVNLIVNHFRNIAEHILVMVTSNRPVMEARAVNTDYKSLSQTYLANGILDYYMREKGLENALKKACEMAIVLGSGFIKLNWNATSGETFDADPETGEMAYEGELEFTNLSQFDVVVDGTKESWNNEWIMCRSFENRFNLMAKYPELSDKIKGIPSKSSSAVYRLGVWSNDDTDDIPIYEFFHKRTEAMPDGRYLLFAATDCVLMDAKMPYRTLPVFRIAPADIMGTPYGYTNMFDILPLQEGLNSLYSTVMTNQNAFGVQNLWVPPGSNIQVSALPGAMNVVESEVKPEALQLTATAPEIFNFINMLVEASETLSGVNSVARGNPESSLKSGTALALVQSMALQFLSGLQQSYVELIEDVGTAIINILKDFAKTPKIVALVGKNNRTFLKEFTGEEISAINRVVIDVGNPLSRCFGKDTQILMADGSKKSVQDIIIGEQVMGPDSFPRTVRNTASGKEEMFKITSKDTHRGVEYVCNKSHILTLKYCSDDYRYDAKKGDVIDITVGDFLQLSDRQQRLLQGFKVGVQFETKPLEIPPYILGLWLGDGHSRTPAITTMDSEVLTEWTNYADSLNLKIRSDEQTSKATTYHITTGIQNGSSDRNIFMNHLRDYDLIKNKHVPDLYLKGSRTQRLELLAGLLDTDGHLNGQTFLFTQKTGVMTDQIKYLSESLGFRTTVSTRDTAKSDLCPNATGTVDIITIGGNTWEIPTKIVRKQSKEKTKARDWLNYGIKVESLGEGDYYGFTLREEPHFLLGDFTVTHNTIAGRVQMAEQLLQMKAIKDPNQYFQVLNTGRIDSLYQGDMAELMLIQSENERLMDGEAPQVSPLDSHKSHILEHRAVLADPDLRKDVNLIKNTLDHIEAHLNALTNTDPRLLQLIGETPIPPLGAVAQGNPQMVPVNQEVITSDDQSILQMQQQAAMSAQQGVPGMPPPQQQGMNTGPLNRSAIPNVIAQQNGIPKIGDTVIGPGQVGQQLPKLPHPSHPLENLPVKASQTSPPMPR